MAIESNIPAKGTPHHADNWLPSMSAAKARPGSKLKKTVRAKRCRTFTNISLFFSFFLHKSMALKGLSMQDNQRA
jgi:hypothetical protein